MASLLIKAVDATNPDPDIDRGCYKAGMIVEVREDNAPRGLLEKWPAFAWIHVPGVPADVVRKYAEPEYHVLEIGAVKRRRRWQIRWADLPMGVRNKFAAKGEITIKAGDYSGAYDYLWSTMGGFFRDMLTGQDEGGNL